MFLFLFAGIAFRFFTACALCFSISNYGSLFFFYCILRLWFFSFFFIWKLGWDLLFMFVEIDCGFCFEILIGV